MTDFTDRAGQADKADKARAWLGFHCFLHCSPEDTDAFLQDDLAPFLDGLVERGESTGWFFIRYDEGGPHLRVRVRVREPAPSRTDALSASLAVLAKRRADHAEIRPTPYVPETERYGGAEVLPVAEEVFVLSSRVAVRAAADAPRGSARLALALDLAHITAAACGMDRLTAAQWLRRQAAGWRWAEGVPLLAPRHIHTRADTVYAAQREALLGRADALRRAVEEGTVTGPLLDWYEGVRAAEAAMRASSGTVDTPRVWGSQLHMLFNRIGIAPDEERAVCLLGARTLLDEGGEHASYFDTGHRAADRRYLELSKFRIGREQDSAARSIAPPASPASPASSGAPDGASALVPLPADELPDVALRSVMAARTSGRGTLGGPLTAGKLGALLWASHASGHQSRTRLPDGTERVLNHRPYPSPGAFYPSGIRLIVLDVDGLSPGTYQAVPDRRALLRIGPGPEMDDIRAMSSYLSRPPGDPDGIVPDELPVLLGLYVDLRRLRQRYGLRALRLGLLEAGHLAQTVLLTATALGLTTTPLNGFRDDVAHETLGLDDLDQPLQYLLPIGCPSPAA